jgi:hypothetical protein
MQKAFWSFFRAPLACAATCDRRASARAGACHDMSSVDARRHRGEQARLRANESLWFAHTLQRCERTSAMRGKPMVASKQGKLGRCQGLQTQKSLETCDMLSLENNALKSPVARSPLVR